MTDEQHQPEDLTETPETDEANEQPKRQGLNLDVLKAREEARRAAMTDEEREAEDERIRQAASAAIQSLSQSFQARMSDLHSEMLDAAKRMVADLDLFSRFDYPKIDLQKILPAMHYPTAHTATEPVILTSGPVKHVNIEVTLPGCNCGCGCCTPAGSASDRKQAVRESSDD